MHSSFRLYRRAALTRSVAWQELDTWWGNGRQIEIAIAIRCSLNRQCIALRVHNGCYVKPDVENASTVRCVSRDLIVVAASVGLDV